MKNLSWSPWSLLRSPDPAEGAPAMQTAEQINVAQTGKVDLQPPPAASIVIEGEVNEELISTRKKLDETERKKKEVEIRASELEDENRRLKQAGVTATAAPVKDDSMFACLERHMRGEDV